MKIKQVNRALHIVVSHKDYNKMVSILNDDKIGFVNLGKAFEMDASLYDTYGIIDEKNSQPFVPVELEKKENEFIARKKARTVFLPGQDYGRHSRKKR